MYNPKCIVFTGGNRGIGKAVANHFAGQGKTVIITSRNADYPDLQDWKKTQRDSPIVVQLDVTREDSIKKFFQWFDSTGLSLDILINNAGIGIFEPFEEVTLDNLKKQINVNIIGAFLSSQHAVKRIKKTGRGRIINMGSISGKMPISHNSTYGLTKYALRGLTAILNEEQESLNIGHTLLSLGAVYTEIWQERKDFDSKDMIPIAEVIRAIDYIAYTDPLIRLEEIVLYPNKGVL